MNKYQKTLITVASIASLALAFPALADSQAQNQGQQGGGIGGFFSSMFHMGRGGQQGPQDQSGQPDQQGQPGRPMMEGNRMGQAAVIGNVTAISGTTITVQQAKRPNASSTSLYTVDASNAVIYNRNATSSISSIAIGNTIIVQGTLSGTNVTATLIRDVPMGPNNGMGLGKGKEGDNKRGPTSTEPMLQGNGQPIVIGSIASINGNSVVVTNKSNATYTVDVSAAHIIKQGVNGTTTVASLAVGDGVIVQGVVNGNSITASTLIDRGVPPVGNNSSASSSDGSKPKPAGIFGSIGNFFSHLFGF